MTAFETLRFEEHDRVATIRLARRGGNRINVRMLQELSAVCDHLEDESDAKVVVFRGEGGTFSLGIDFEDFHPDRPLDIHGFNKWEKLCVRLERLPKATVALVDGPANGGGFQLALVADLRIATPEASFQLPEVHLGFLPGMATFRLAKYVGLGRARRIALTAERITAEGAAELGLVDRVDADLDAGLTWAVDALGPNHAVAVELTRRLLNESFHVSFEDAIGHFLAAQHRAISQTAFLETLRRRHEDG